MFDRSSPPILYVFLYLKQKKFSAPAAFPLRTLRAAPRSIAQSVPARAWRTTNALGFFCRAYMAQSLGKKKRTSFFSPSAVIITSLGTLERTMVGTATEFLNCLLAISANSAMPLFMNKCSMLASNSARSYFLSTFKVSARYQPRPRTGDSQHRTQSANTASPAASRTRRHTPHDRPGTNPLAKQVASESAAAVTTKGASMSAMSTTIIMPSAGARASGWCLAKCSQEPIRQRAPARPFIKWMRAGRRETRSTTTTRKQIALMQRRRGKKNVNLNNKRNCVAPTSRRATPPTRDRAAQWTTLG